MIDRQERQKILDSVICRRFWKLAKAVTRGGTIVIDAVKSADGKPVIILNDQFTNWKWDASDEQIAGLREVLLAAFPDLKESIDMILRKEEIKQMTWIGGVKG